MFRHRQYWIILALTAMVWLIAAMSEHHEYPISIRVQWTGFDTARYAVTYADTLLPVTITSNCFNAISRYRTVKEQPLTIQATDDTVIKVSNTFLKSMQTQMGFIGSHGCVSSVETLRLSLVERQCKAFVPQLADVEFQFANLRGLCGEPRLQPDTVYLYGSAAELEKIKQLRTAPAAITGIDDSSTYRLALDPVWLRCHDVRSSHDSVTLFLPVEHYSERTFSIPIQFHSDNPNSRVRLYPDKVDVTLWVSISRYHDLDPSDIVATVDYDGTTDSKALPVRIVRFPSYSRVKQVTPNDIQYVIIK